MNTAGNMAHTTPVVPITTLNATKPAPGSANKAGLAQYVNAKTMLIVVVILVVGYMAWPMVFPAKKESDTTPTVAEKPPRDDEMMDDDTEDIEAAEMSSAAMV